MGEDWCILVTGGDRPHFGAVGWSGGGEAPFSIDLPQHRDSAVVDIFLAALHKLPGRHLIAAGVHVDGISRVEIEAILEDCRIRATQLAAELLGEEQ